MLCEYLHLPPSLWRPAAPSPRGGPPALRAAVDRLRSIAREATPEGKARVLIQTRRLAVEAILAEERRARRALGGAAGSGAAIERRAAAHSGARRRRREGSTARRSIGTGPSLCCPCVCVGLERGAREIPVPRRNAPCLAPSPGPAFRNRLLVLRTF